MHDRRRPRHRPRHYGHLIGCSAMVLALLAAACTSDDGDRRAALNVPTTVAPLAEFGLADETVATVPLPAGFVPPDTRGAPLLGFPELEEPSGPPIPVFGGEATLQGRVVGPDGAGAGGATVRIERFVGRSGGFADVVTDEDGRYAAEGVFGGHYRVRAWIRPNLSTVAPQTTFLGAEETMTVDVAMELHEGLALSAAIVVPELEVGVPTILQALLVEKAVDEEGIVRGTPVPEAEVALVPVAGGVRLDSPNPASTDADGLATFVIVCLSAAEHTVAVYSSGEQFAYQLPGCLPGTGEIPPPVPTDTPPRPAPPEVAVEPFPIGSSFTPPKTGPLPPGVYVVSSGSGTNCVTSYEVYANGRWSLTQTTGTTMRLESPARNFRAVGASRPCTFLRVR